ncbi:putative glycosyl hydrolase, five-bladed beta-propellor domain superfamily [Septoria linicola]|nr:putative glycosyl hydrolase, five-bladed beta-propellor domain superfamily [Septoria linicola]
MKASLSYATAALLYLTAPTTAQNDVPLITNQWTADPSAYNHGGRLYLCPSHDIDAGVPPNSEGDHFAMRDYHVFSFNNSIGSPITDHGIALKLEDVPWASHQLWGPEVAYRDGWYYF